LYAFNPTVDLADVSVVLAKVQASLELGDLQGIGEEERAAVAGYSRFDAMPSRPS